MTIQEVRAAIEKNEWTSIAPEIRPSTVKTPSGDIKPLYCSRRFVYPGDDAFHLTFMNYADAFGKVPLVEMLIKGHIRFGGPHPIATGAYELDYIADTGFAITVLHEGLAGALNQAPLPDGIAKWEVNVPQDVLRKSVPAFGLSAGKYFTECDLIYVWNGLLFNGNRNIDGRPFDKPENRPTNLQIPLKPRAAAL
jgi:hypothetical protein